MLDNALIPLYLLAKVPRPGQSKTRLQPQLGPQGAADLAMHLLQRTLKTLYLAWPGTVVLYVWPDPGDTIFKRLVESYPVMIEPQQDTDLGERMMAAIQKGVAQSGAAAVVGCDLPQLNADILKHAHSLLVSGQNVIGPAEDGGFYLLGLQHAERRLFHNVNWGSDQVLTQVFKQAAVCNIDLISLPTLRDIDKWADLVWLSKHDPSFNHFVQLKKVP